MISKRKKGSPYKKNMEATAEEIAAEKATFEASLEWHKQVDEDVRSPTPGTTHVRSRQPDGFPAITRRRFSAIPEKK